MPQFDIKHYYRVACTLLVLAIAPLMSTMLYAQDGAESVRPGEEIFQVVAPTSKIRMIMLDTRVLETPNRIKIVDGFNPDILTVSALSPNRVRMHAESAGVTTIKLIDEFDTVFSIEVFVEPDTRELKAYLDRLFPGSSIEVVGLRDSCVLRGWVTEPTHIPQIMQVAEQFYPEVQNQLNVGGVSQVQLHVKVIEVQRTKLRELGFNFLALGQQYSISNTISGLAPLASMTVPFGGPPVSTVNAASLPNSELQFAIAGNSNTFQGFLKALQSEALAKILAEPVLVTTSGRPASMLSGGEFPILVPGGVGAATIEWREFGVRLEAVPIVLGNGRLRLDVAPEVSDRDFSNAVSIDGFVVPGVTVRRVNTQVEMKFGETLMVGGLISTRRNGTTQKVPFLGELPWIGAAFSRKTYSVGETELIILVTPQMVAPMLPHQVPQQGPGMLTDTPVDKELYFDGMLEVPSYGPECPDCEIPNDSYFAPEGMIMPNGGMPQNIPPFQEYPAGSGIPTTPPDFQQSSDAGPLMIQQTSGEESKSGVQQASGAKPAVGTNPFRIDVKADRDVTTNSQPKLELKRSTSPQSTKPPVQQSSRRTLQSLMLPSRSDRGGARPNSQPVAPTQKSDNK